MCLNTLTNSGEVQIKGYINNDKSNKEMNHITWKFAASSFSPYKYLLLRSSFWPPKIQRHPVWCLPLETKNSYISAEGKKIPPPPYTQMNKNKAYTEKNNEDMEINSNRVYPPPQTYLLGPEDNCYSEYCYKWEYSC